MILELVLVQFSIVITVGAYYYFRNRQMSKRRGL